jgi:hypothetical protein
MSKLADQVKALANRPDVIVPPLLYPKGWMEKAELNAILPCPTEAAIVHLTTHLPMTRQTAQSLIELMVREGSLKRSKKGRLSRVRL